MGMGFIHTYMNFVLKRILRLVPLYYIYFWFTPAPKDPFTKCSAKDLWEAFSMTHNVKDTFCLQKLWTVDTHF